MSDLLKEISGVTRRKQNECKACFLLAGMDSDEREAIDAALTEGASPTALAGVLGRNGYDVTGENLARHHNKGHRLS